MHRRTVILITVVLLALSMLACGLSAQVGCTQINPTNAAIRFAQQHPACDAVDCDGCGYCWCADSEVSK